MAFENWVCYKAVVPNGQLFFVEYKTFIIVVDLLKIPPHLDLSLSYIEEKNSF